MEAIFEFLYTLGELLITTPIGAILLGMAFVSFLAKAVR